MPPVVVALHGPTSIGRKLVAPSTEAEGLAMKPVQEPHAASQQYASTSWR